MDQTGIRGGGEPRDGAVFPRGDAIVRCFGDGFGLFHVARQRNFLNFFVFGGREEVAEAEYIGRASDPLDCKVRFLDDFVAVVVFVEDCIPKCLEVLANWKIPKWRWGS